MHGFTHNLGGREGLINMSSESINKRRVHIYIYLGIVIILVIDRLVSQETVCCQS